MHGAVTVSPDCIADNVVIFPLSSVSPRKKVLRSALGPFQAVSVKERVLFPLHTADIQTGKRAPVSHMLQQALECPA